MAELKTKLTEASVEDFLNQVEEESKKKDSFAVLKLMEKITGKKAKMWGSSIVGFDSYHYKSERSSQEGDWPIVGFSPRKQNLTIYIMPGFDAYTDLMEKLGKYKISKSCLYLKSLGDVDGEILEKLISSSVKFMRDKYSVE